MDYFYEFYFLNGTDYYYSDIFQDQHSVAAGIHIQSSSSISFFWCTFEHFEGQAIKLTNVSEYINITSCNFTHNNYRGDGAAIYVAKTENPLQMFLSINEAYFGTNGPAHSIVYLHGHEHQMSKCKHILISNAKFSLNKATSLLLINQTIHISGNILFEENVGSFIGAGISGIGSNIIFDEDCNIVSFYKNRARYGGGAFLLYHSLVSFASNTTVHFFGNTAFVGGAVYSDFHSEIIFETQSNASFVNNTALIGGAIYSAFNSSIKFENNSLVQFILNTAEGGINYITGCIESCGGAIFQENHSIILIAAKSLALFTNNVASQSGGAIYSCNYAKVIFEGNASFINNTATFGGALCFDSSCLFTFNGNTSFINSTDEAIPYYSEIIFEGNASFINNTASFGGALYFDSACIFKFQGNSLVEFENNVAVYGGAIHGLNANGYIWQLYIL